MKKLYRSQRDKKLFGLCGGLAERFHIDSTIVRLIVLISVFVSGGTTILIYLLACLIVPKEPQFVMPYQPYESYSPRKQSSYSEASVSSDLDEMMNDIEMKAMRNELQQLRSKLTKYDQGEK